MLKRILVPLDVSDYAEAATHRAGLLARANYAAVTGMVVLDTPEIRGMSLPDIPVRLLDYTVENIESRTKEAEQRIQDELERFAYRCEQAHVPHNEAEFQGVPSEKIIQASHYFDLVVMGLRTFFHFETQEGPGDSLAKVLGHTPTPVLAIPKISRQPLCKVLIAYDGSLSSVRAMHAFAQMAWPEKVDVTVLMSHADENYRSVALREATAYLRSHSIDTIHAIGTDREIKQLIDEDFIEKTDLVVLGMHAKHRIKDFFVGSLAKQLIDHGHTALLLA